MTNWRFFGRTSGSGEIYEIYRIPADGKPFHEHLQSGVERLSKSGCWLYDPKDKAIWLELMKGNFVEAQDEMTKEEVAYCFEIWSKGRWPGRS